MKVEFVILNYFSFDDVVRLVEMISKPTKGVKVRIQIVDNGDSVQGAEELKLLVNQDIDYTSLDNLGYAKGNNVGIEKALNSEPDFIVVCNPDVDFSLDKFFMSISNVIETDDKVAVYGAEVKGLKNYTEDISLLSILFPFIYRLRDHKELSHELTRFHGCFFVINSSFFKYSIPFFDETTFLYYEELLFAKKIHGSGFKLRKLNNFVVSHVGSKSVTKKIKYRQYLYQYQSLRYLIQKHYIKSKMVSAFLAFTSIFTRVLIQLIKK